MNKHRTIRFALVSILAAITAPSHAQKWLTPDVKIELPCKADEPILLIVKGDETDPIILHYEKGYWTGTKASDLLLQANGTVGSLRLGNSRTDSVPSKFDPDSYGTAAFFKFHCSDSPVYDLRVQAENVGDVSYVRLLAHKEEGALDSKDWGLLTGQKPIPDLRFSGYSVGAPNTKKPGRNAPFEYLCLQPGRRKPALNLCGLIFNEPAVVKAAKAGFNKPVFVALRSKQKSRGAFSELPTFSSVAITYDESTLRDFSVTLTLDPQPK